MWFDRRLWGKLKQRSLLLTDLGRSVWHTYSGHTGRSRQDACREIIRTWGNDFIRVQVGCFGYPGKGRISQFKPKRVGFYLRDTQGEGTHGDSGRMLLTRTAGKVISGTLFACESSQLFRTSKPWLEWLTSVQSPFSPLGHTKWMSM